MKACETCHIIVKSGENCDLRKTPQLSAYWNVYVAIIDPENSEIAKKMDIAIPGSHALKVR